MTKSRINCFTSFRVARLSGLKYIWYFPGIATSSITVLRNVPVEMGPVRCVRDGESLDRVIGRAFAGVGVSLRSLHWVEKYLALLVLL